MTESEIAIRDGAITLADTAPDPARNPYWTYLARMNSSESRRTMQGCLDRLAAALTAAGDAGDHPGQLVQWHRLRYQHVIMIRAALTSRDWSPSHVNKHLCALRGVLKEAWRLGLMTAEDYHRAADVEQVTASREPAGRNIHSDEIAKVLAACLADENVPLGVRDAAMTAVLQSTGMRREEVAAARIERYDSGERSLRVIGKGNAERTVYIHPTAVPYLDRWLAVIGARRGPVFRPVDKWGNIAPRHLSARSVGHTVDRRRREAGLQPTTTHDYRRTFIGDVIDAGGDLVQAQQLAGHKSPITTAQYDRRPARKRRAAVDRLHLPAPEDLHPKGAG